MDSIRGAARRLPYNLREDFRQACYLEILESGGAAEKAIWRVLKRFQRQLKADAKLVPLEYAEKVVGRENV